LQNLEYTKSMGFQLLYFHYLKEIQHPFLRLLDQSPQSLVGEDIELSLMLLSNYSSTTSMNRVDHDISQAYKKLGVLSEIARKVRNYKVSRFGGTTEARSRVVYSDASQEALDTAAFVRNCIARTEHYGLLTYSKRKGHIPKRAKAEAKAKRYRNVDLIEMRWQPLPPPCSNDISSLS
jgi:hypothetical protein